MHWLGRHRRVTLALICAVCTGVIIAAAAFRIIFDLTFDPDRAGDEEFRAALDRHRDRVVIGADIEANANPETARIGIIFVPPNKAVIPDGFMDDRVGFVSLWPDPDSRIRRVNYAMSDSQILEKMNGLEPGPAKPSETIYESLDGRSLRKLGFSGRIPPAGLSAMIRFGPTDAYQPRSLFEIFVPAY